MMQCGLPVRAGPVTQLCSVKCIIVQGGLPHHTGSVHDGGIDGPIFGEQVRSTACWCSMGCVVVQDGLHDRAGSGT